MQLEHRSDRRDPRAATAGFAALLGLLALRAAAQDEAAPVQGEFFDRIGVEIVNVEVYVTDAQGEPVPGLTLEDFVATEDGKPVELVNFYSTFDDPSEESADRQAPGPSSEPAALGRSAAESSAGSEAPLPWRSEQVAVPESQRLHLVVYVDNSNIHPLNRNRVFGRLRTFLRDTLRAGDEVMVASYDRSLHVRQPFTTNPRLANETLIELEGLSGYAVERESERRDALQEIYETRTLHTAQFRAKQFAENQLHEVGNALDGLREMIDSLGGLPGRKMLLHLSDGIPMVPGQDLYQAIQQRFADQSALSEAFTRDMSREYMQLIAHANSNRVSFYTIDAGGLRVRSGMGAENATINNQIPVSVAVDGVRARNLQDTLRLMADRTGGQSILNTNDVSAGLERMARDVGNYYSIGYRAPTTDRGRYHRIEVRLANPQKGWELRHREGYRDKSVEAKVADGARAFLIHGYQTNPLAVTLDVGNQSETAEGLVAVPIEVRIPLDKLVLLPRGEIYEARLRIYFGATDEEGREAPMQELPFDLRIPASAIEMAKRDQVSRVIDATMRPGPHKLVVAVRDEIGAETSVVGRHLMVGAR
ncbi:MAG TPA: VWA domain-containing protein [Thermoanaerobaculia bacterium]|nr:VWA domain-containing protein [Thermoanaerobaculia bacterium]